MTRPHTHSRAEGSAAQGLDQGCGAPLPPVRSGAAEAPVAVVAAELPRGRAEVTAVYGGLNVHDAEQQTTHVIANAAIEAFLPIDAADWRLSSAD